MNPIFRFIDWMLREHGPLFLACSFMWLSHSPPGMWGGVPGKKTKTSHTFVLVIRPPAPTSSGVPPVIRWNFEPPDDANGLFDEL